MASLHALPSFETTSRKVKGRLFTRLLVKRQVKVNIEVYWLGRQEAHVGVV